MPVAGSNCNLMPTSQVSTFRRGNVKDLGTRFVRKIHFWLHRYAVRGCRRRTGDVLNVGGLIHTETGRAFYEAYEMHAWETSEARYPSD